jgi:hypothetical protein
LIFRLLIALFWLNIETGAWFDQATNERGGDVVSLVAAQDGTDQGEAAKQIASELGLTLAAQAVKRLYAPTTGFPKHLYTYFNPDGSEAYKIGRWEAEGCEKSIRPGHINERGQFVQGMAGAKEVLYNLVGIKNRPGVLESTFVVIVEGEKKVEALLNLGICATCNPFGAGKWKDAYSEYLKDKAVVILSDNDKPGKDHAAKVASSVASVAEYVKIVELPGLPDKGDIVDWLKVPGNDKERLRALMNDAPYWKLEPKKDSLVVINSDELVTMDITPRGHVLYPAIPEQGLAMLFAPRGIGKTMLAMSIANAVAGGGVLFGGKNGPAWFAPKARRVLYIDGEMPLHAMKSRQQAIQAGFNFAIPSKNLNYLNPEMQPDFLMPKLATKAGQEQLDTVLDDVELIIIDNLATLCAHGRENDTESWQPVQEWILQLRRRGKSVLIIHHAGKNGDQRGTSGKEDVLDTVIKLRRPDDYMNEDGARFMVELTKARGLCGPEANPFEASIIQDNDALLWTAKNIGNQELESV